MNTREKLAYEWGMRDHETARWRIAYECGVQDATIARLRHALEVIGRYAEPRQSADGAWHSVREIAAEALR